MKRKYKISGGDTAGKYFNSHVPLDTLYHSDLRKKKIKEHIDENEEFVKRLDKDLNEARIDKRIEQKTLNTEKENAKKVRMQNESKYYDINTKWSIFVWSGIGSLLKYIFSAIGSLIHILIFKVLAGLLQLVFSMIRIVFTNYVFVGFILFLISVILILQFVFGYIVPLPGFVSKKPPETNIMNKENLAERKIEYQVDFIKQLRDIFTDFPNMFFNSIVNIRRLYQKLAKFFGNDNIMDLYLTDREETKAGRWDNIFNMQLGLMTQDYENIPSGNDGIYSIIKPTSLNMNLKNIDKSILDIHSLPPSLQENIIKDKEALKFEWELDGTKTRYKLSCIPKDSNNNPIYDIYKEADNNKCLIVKKEFVHEKNMSNDPKYYDKSARRGNKPLYMDQYL